MNASVHLLRQALPSVVHLRATVPDEHPSAAILGSERNGTGTVVAAGVVLTAHYLLIGADTIEVTTSEGTTLPGTTLGVDFACGLGVLRVDEDHLPVLPVRARDEGKIGEDVFLVSSVGDGHRVASGAVSSIGPFEAFWEYLLDRAITTTAGNPGLGGGPLIDSRGRMMGVVALSLAEVGKFTMAIPTSYYLAERSRLLGRTGAAQSAPRAWLGLTCYTLRHHVVIASLIPGGPAENAGLKPGDVILELDGAAVSDRRGLYSRFWRHHAGERLQLRVFRNNGTQTIEVTAGSIEEFFA
jgi:S1-C subfamily serine protease